ncbi:raffinose invertase-like [Epargyreus clarus]|uniref:raffinose invertase-like n=1 Tax=Epargyreus clarus TaxID=520877 RepID=UPI003C2FE360
MEILIFLVWIPTVVLAMLKDFEHVEDFINQRRYFVKKKYRPNYHITAPEGWLSNPTGFVYFKKQYHVFYQYHPNRGAWGHMHWGHSASKNLIDWTHYPPALIPKEYYDKHGCFAGSAQVHDNYLYLFYTGSLVFSNRTFETQSVALSVDGILYQKYLYNPVIRESPHGVEEFRNPKVWKFRQTWYMIIGTTSRERNGQLLLYSSQDLVNWKFYRVLAESYGDMGYVWESPDIFEIEDQYVLIISAQGIQSEGHRFRNLYQTGYVVGSFNYLHGQFDDLEVSTATFNELDYGHDFYAAKTMLAPDGRILLVAWLGMWESDFLEAQSGWAGMLTLIREVRMNKQGRITMTPVRETAQLRTEILEEAWYSPGEAFLAGAKFFEMLVNTSAVFSDVIILLEWSGGRYTIAYSSEAGQITVDRGGEDGIRRADWSPNHHVYFHIFVDSSSIEVFCGEGEVVFSSRIYPKSIKVKIEGKSQVHIAQYSLKRSIGFDKNLVKYLKSHVIKSLN